DPLAPLLDVVEVLLHDDDVVAGIERDDVAREAADVDDVADHARLAGLAEGDLLGPHGDAAPVALEDVRRADEPGDELSLRALVHVLRRADLLDAAVAEHRNA